jgi:hypothetical protein
MTTDAFLVGFLVVAVVALVVFVVLREFWTWYWKQSEQVALLKSIDARLARLAGERPPGAGPTRTLLERALNEDPQPPRVPMSAAPMGSVPTSVRS